MAEVVLVFGDSIPMGLWDTERGGWPERLWDSRTRIVYNLGVDGETSDDVASRFLPEAKNRANKKSTIILAVGINDSSRMNGKHRVELDKYIQNIEEMIDMAREKVTQKVVCVGLGPIDQSLSVPFPLEPSISFYTQDQREYDSALEALCRKKDVRYVSLRDAGIEKHLSEDGVHPLSTGHAIIAAKVLETLAQLANVPATAT